MLIAILLVAGIVIVSRHKEMKKVFWQWFGWLTGILLVGYFLIDHSIIHRLPDLLGIVFLSFLIALLVAFLKKDDSGF